MSENINGKKAELKDRLREALSAKNMKPIELSDTTGIPKSMISYYLSGKALPKADRIYKMSHTLDVSEAWLMGYDVPKTRTPEQKKNDSLAETIVKMRQHPNLTEAIYKIVSLYEQSPEAFASVDRILSGLVNK